MINFDASAKYSSKPLQAKMYKECIIKQLSDQYRLDLGELKLSSFKDMGCFEEIVKDCCERIEMLLPHMENDLKLDKRQLVVDIIKTLFPDLTVLDEANIHRFVLFIVGNEYKQEFALLKWLMRRLKKIFCRSDQSKKKNEI